MTPKLKKSLLYWLLLSPLCVVILLPFGVMFVTALRPRDELFVYPPTWTFSEFRWENFVEMWVKTNFGGALLNSLYVSLTSTIIAIVLSIPAAYALSRYRFSGKGLYRNFLLMTQMMSPIVLVLGLFRLMVHLNLVNSLNSLVVTYVAFNMAFTIWMLQSYFNTIPRELEEASWIDGATSFTSLVKIFLPLAVPAMVVTAIFTFINSWNEFVLALTLIRSQNDYTLPVQIFSQVAGRYQVEWHHVMAATVLATVPVAIVFSWLQRYLIRGMALGAVK
ncbi:MULTISPECIES: carbohydrate ABC transporter permease [unclassified Mesorhizobium]|jgi:multiple sugar transport system permease protein|uniref:carbohydrate ABC transporter permease n=1 Tax=unclassified Mesorhizobium TaxID=325217 RepID=UPI000FE3D9DD|nr:MULTISPECIES: carbohydrate ABC transporter permease [unclassified Mesorhizobium]MDG4895613.1 carbohydrate ABC transporter permease [Mesorhizobium sp. WSM4976]RWH70554.1 MAG: carbohydrate ABC transporter permease [Mesorhizobium sp.]RWL24110.1 MAG: carbohydrate ABC transporter permease [Mesorhizobium sp.]RWL30171.1 MAG: carbohydrate ABC transporter permease [Mesorhizobium sp.]RWL37047.1 MAG: carbohydrate ABC transporter permease [Mesorhizobium sp.]